MGLWGKTETRGRLWRETHLARSANTEKDLVDSCHLSLIRSTIDQDCRAGDSPPAQGHVQLPRMPCRESCSAFLVKTPETAELRRSFEQFRPTQGDAGRIGPLPDLPRTNSR